MCPVAVSTWRKRHDKWFSSLCRNRPIPAVIETDNLSNFSVIVMSKPPFQALANLGGSNFCFMNSIIQVCDLANFLFLEPLEPQGIPSIFPVPTHSSCKWYPFSICLIALVTGGSTCSCMYCSLCVFDTSFKIRIRTFSSCMIRKLRYKPSVLTSSVSL